MKTSNYFFVFAIGILINTASFAEDGATLFKLRCASCHSIGKGTVVGPDLKGSTSRYDEKWISEWIRSSQKKVLAGDPVAVELFNKFNKIPMPDQDLNEADMKSLLAYIKTETENPTAPIAAAPAATPAATAAGSGVASDPGPVFLYIGLGFIGFIVVAIIWALGVVINNLVKTLEKTREELRVLKGNRKESEEFAV